jgi:hypothetical protein
MIFLPEIEKYNLETHTEVWVAKVAKAAKVAFCTKNKTGGIVLPDYKM